MAKQSGLGDNFYIAGYDVSGDVQSLGSISSPMTPLDSTAINKSAMERLPGKRDGHMEFTTFFNDDTLSDAEHTILKTLPRTDTIVYYARGTSLGSPAAAMIGEQIDYSGSRGDDGSFTFGVSAEANAFGLDWGLQLTPGKLTQGSAGNGTGVDFGTGTTNFGLQAYLQVFAFTGTSATVKLQASSDNAVGDPYADLTGGGFVAVTGKSFQRIQTARNAATERWIRVVTTGTFSNLVFAVMVNRNDVAVDF